MDANAETVPSSDKSVLAPLPSVGFGFLFAGAFLLAEFVEVAQGIEDTSGSLTFAVSLGGMIFWLHCVHRFHQILGQLSLDPYPISPGAAVGWHFMPFYNLYWIFKWPIEFSKFIRAHGPVTVLPGGIVGLLLLLSLLINRIIDGAIGMAYIFGIGLYLQGVLDKQIKNTNATASESAR